MRVYGENLRIVMTIDEFSRECGGGQVGKDNDVVYVTWGPDYQEYRAQPFFDHVGPNSVNVSIELTPIDDDPDDELSQPSNELHIPVAG